MGLKEVLDQEKITYVKITEMCRWSPRRMSLAEYMLAHGDKGRIGLNEPQEGRKDWNLAFPFRESFTTAFNIAFNLVHIGFRSKPRVNLSYTFLKDVTEQDIQEVRRWLATIDHAVAIRDCLAMSFALDYERALGSKDNPQTEIGALRFLAKTYGHQPTRPSLKAADSLAERLVSFIRDTRAYNLTQCLVAVPPSKPQKPFDLPSYLTSKVATAMVWMDQSAAVRTIRQRNQAKNLPVSEKLKEIDETIDVAPGAFKGKVVTLIDDLYQSGTTMNYVGMLLQKAGAKAILGLACEKTLRNDDNVQGAGDP